MSETPPIPQRVGRAAVLALAVACAAPVLAGQGGRWSDTLDAVNHLMPLWAVGAALALGFWFALGRAGWLTPTAAGLALLGSVWMMGPDLIGRVLPKSLPVAGKTLKIVQFNLWELNFDRAAAVRWILAQDADVVVIEEATPPVPDGLRARYPYQSSCAPKGFCSTMILAKHKPLAFGPQFRLMTAWATYPADGGPITVVATHLAWPWPPGRQRAQSLRVATLLKSFPAARTIVAGDFNSTPWSFALRRQDRLFGLQRRTRALFSWPAAGIVHISPAKHRPKAMVYWPIFTIGFLQPGSPMPLFPIDQVYAGKAWRTVSVERGPKLGSDHYPVVVTLTASP